MSTEAAVPASAPVTLRTRFQTGITYNLVGAVFNQGSTFVFTIVAANLFGRHVFGEFAMLQTTILTLAQIAQLGCGVTATRFISEYRAVDKGRVGRILALLQSFSLLAGSCCGLLLAGLSPWLAGGFLKAAELKLAFALAGGVVLFCTLNGLMMGALAGLEAYRRLARALMASGVGYFAICVASAWAGGLNGAVAGLLASAVLQYVLLRRELTAECREQGIPVAAPRWHEERSVLSRFAVPAALSGFTTMPSLWLANAFLARQPDGYVQLALYGAAYTLMTATLFLPNIANTVGMSLLNFHRSESAGAFRRTFWANFAFVVGVVCLGAGALSLLGPFLLRLFGKDFKAGYSVLLVMMLATVLQGIGTAIYQLIYTEQRMWVSFFAIALPRDSMLVVLAYLLIPAHGAIGLATAYTLVCALALAMTIVLASRSGTGLLTSNARLSQHVNS